MQCTQASLRAEVFPQLDLGWGSQKQPWAFGDGQARARGCKGWSPAVNHHWARIHDALLLVVHLLQEVQHTPGITGHAVVRPGPKVVLPDGSLCIALE